MQRLKFYDFVVFQTTISVKTGFKHPPTECTVEPNYIVFATMRTVRHRITPATKLQTRYPTFRARYTAERMKFDKRYPLPSADGPHHNDQWRQTMHTENSKAPSNIDLNPQKLLNQPRNTAASQSRPVKNLFSTYQQSRDSQPQNQPDQYAIFRPIPKTSTSPSAHQFQQHRHPSVYSNWQHPQYIQQISEASIWINFPKGQLLLGHFLDPEWDLGIIILWNKHTHLINYFH